MKKRCILFWGSLSLICCIAIAAMIVISNGKSEVASFENYVVGGFGGFLIMENLVIPLYVIIGILIVSFSALMYNLLKKK